MRPGQRILEGLDLVVGRDVFVVAAAKRHRETGQPADRHGRKPHDLVVVRIDALYAQRADHGIAV